MKVNQNVSIFAGADINGRAGRGVLDGKAQNGKTIFAAGLKGPFDPIEQKRALAKKQAYKIVGDTFASERKLDNELKGRADRVTQLQKEKGEAGRKIMEIDAAEEELRMQYDVDADSEEQADLEIMKKYARYKKTAGWPLVTGDDFSEEEMKRAQELEEKGYAEGYTEYQKRVMGMEPRRYPIEENIRDIGNEIIKENAIIRATDQERLKHHAMLDASKQAEEILAEASDEIIGMLVDEAKETIDKKQEEEQEKLEERKEEKKEKEEKLEAAEERRAEMEALADPEHAEEQIRRERRRMVREDVLSGDVLTENLLKLDSVQNDVKQEVKDIMMEMKLVAEDIKGIKVDTEI